LGQLCSGIVEGSEETFCVAARTAWGGRWQKKEEEEGEDEKTRTSVYQENTQNIILFSPAENMRFEIQTGGQPRSF
jgi:hypothetical protein